MTINAPGAIRDPIIEFLSAIAADAGLHEIIEAVRRQAGDVPPSSVRSYLNNNTPQIFERTSRRRYRLRLDDGQRIEIKRWPSCRIGQARLYQADSLEWLAQQPVRSIHAFVTDPPYGLLEYTDTEKAKLRAGRGGVWRIPPRIGGHQRAPLPRFTVLNHDDKRQLYTFFKRLGILIARAAVPGANVIVASNPLLSHVVASAMSESGLELRGYIARQVMTARRRQTEKRA